ncbi:MAG TPA: hypothetical protein VFW98_04905 [Gemmatimonadaceae bacterium]|nr:hypothetical protein [Gemmatimonadaceae bacterium]
MFTATVALLLMLTCSTTAFGQSIHLHPVRIPNTLSYWPQHGFVQMEPPVRLPTTKSIHEYVMVWLRIPAGEKIGVRWLPDQKRYTLTFPPGTVADRIDGGQNAKQAMFTVNGIADVRGATIAADGRVWWHVYEPVPGKSSKWLMGDAWLRSGPAGDDLAADSLLKLYYPGAPTKAKQEMAEFRRLNQCGACHQTNRPIPKTTASKYGFATPETDATGFFQPITVLTDPMTLVNDRPWDLNVDDPYITVWCGTHKAKLHTKGNSERWYSCTDHRVPVGKLEMAAALKHKDPHARKVCASRRYLYEHMTAKGRDDFARYFAECSIP